ncbi:MAG: M23 family metallopeptidase [Bacteroidia bacterium]|nr:M23 family metallopeptidase [Bacteroidia bacterium]
MKLAWVMRRFLHRFEWDEQTLTFRRIPWSPWQTLKAIPRSLFWGMLVGGGLIPFTYSYWESYFIESVQTEVQALHHEKRRLVASIQSIEAHRAVLYERVQKFYRPLLGLPPLPASEWDGGMGGAPSTPEELSLYRGHRLISEYLSLQKQLAEVNGRLERMPCLMPLQGRILSGFGYRTDPFTGAWQMHTGLDIDAPYGAPVRAAAAGKVIFAGWDYGGGYGIQVEIDHLNGLVTKYAHLSRLAVKEGDTVMRGQTIGYVGSTGYSTGAHLHYEVIERGVKVNPQKYLLLP